MVMRELLRRLGNGRAVDNARSAATELSRRRVEREEVEIFLQRHGAVFSPGLSAPGEVVADGQRGRP